MYKKLHDQTCTVLACTRVSVCADYSIVIASAHALCGYTSRREWLGLDDVDFSSPHPYPKVTIYLSVTLLPFHQLPSETESPRSRQRAQRQRAPRSTGTPPAPPHTAVLIRPLSHGRALAPVPLVPACRQMRAGGGAEGRRSRGIARRRVGVLATGGLDGVGLMNRLQLRFR